MRLIDLFSGCGGFSLGAHQSGFSVAAAFDNDETLTSSFPLNFPRTRLFLADVAKLDGATVRRLVGARIDGVFGGPPCQGFSDIGRRDRDDPRRKLVWHFFRIVSELQPSFFVMENVRGLAYLGARDILEEAQDLLRDRYRVWGPVLLDAADFGAATARRRLFMVGIHKGRGDQFALEDLQPYRIPAATVRAAIDDLRDAVHIGERANFDVWRIARAGRPSGYAKVLRSRDSTFTGHRPTLHSDAVTRRFAEVAQGAVDLVGRHHRLSWEGQCPTLRAGTGVDRGSYQSVRPLHPEEPRVITVREAARLQGFPDEHLFHPTVWHSFRMIGNSVVPSIAKAIFSAIQPKVTARRLIAAE
ncbi:MAG: DNA cytosine methyltransferase [Dechloromonas sp.]|nr:DNA cytosine methyltransferase [Dechloromonas sp.]